MSQEVTLGHDCVLKFVLVGMGSWDFNSWRGRVVMSPVWLGPEKV